MTEISFRLLSRLLLVSFAFLLLSSQLAAQEKMDGMERNRLKTMLRDIKSQIKKDYYDTTFHGIDIDARFKQAEDRLNQVMTTGQGLGVIAQALIDFNDSHLYFIPPATNVQVEYGWRAKMIGDKCFVIAVKPESDAEVRGLKIGDQILAVENFRPSRSELWKMMYYYSIIGKRPSLNLTILSPGSDEPRTLSIASKVTKLPTTVTEDNFFRLTLDTGDSENDLHLFRKMGNITVWRMPAFDLSPGEVDAVMKDKIGNPSGLVIDLRTNGGGSVKTLERLAGYFFETDMKIADLKARKPMDPMALKTRGNDRFSGKVIVLISSESGSAAEVFARLLQLQNRGKVLGDVSAGAVMQASWFRGGTDAGITYGASITNADVIMSDGKSIEHVGVVPDELILPTGADLAAGKDPVLARAIELLGGRISVEEAGKMFPYSWKKKIS
jgi:C-terminal processing protease CtpA/Prc